MSRLPWVSDPQGSCSSLTSSECPLAVNDFPIVLKEIYHKGENVEYTGILRQAIRIREGSEKMVDFGASLFSLESEDLRYIYAYLTETTLWSAMAGNVSDFLSKAVKRGSKGQFFQRRVERAVLRSRGVSDEEVRFRLLAELATISKVSLVNFASRKDCTDFCERIARETIALYRKHNPSFTGSTEQDLLRSVMHSMFGRVAEGAKATADDLDEMVTITQEFLQTLPEDQQEEIRRRLGVDDLSRSILKRLIAQGSMGTVFAVAIDVAGFAAYKGAVIVLASIAKLIGITLPIGIYFKLTSLIAVLSNPIFLVLAIGGGGLLKYRSHNKDVREQFLPVLVCLIMLGQGSANDLSGIERRMDVMIEFWQHRLSAYAQLNGSARSISERLTQEQAILKRGIEKRDSIVREMAMKQSALRSLADVIAADLAANDEIVARLSSLGPGKSEAQRYYRLKKSAMLSATMPRQTSRTLSSLFDGMKRGLVDVKLRVEMTSALRRTAYAVVESLPGPVPNELSRYSEEAKKIRASIEVLRQRQSHAEQEISASKAICSDLKTEKHQLEMDVDRMHRDIPALEEVYFRLRQAGA